MAGYILAFSVYTLAMVGVIFIAFVVYKHAILNKDKNTKSTLKVEEMLNLSSRKTLYIVRVESERYLIASDVDRTTFLAKLPDGRGLDAQVLQEADFFARESAYEKTVSEMKPYGDRTELEPDRTEIIQNSYEKKSTMRNILKELAQKNR